MFTSKKPVIYIGYDEREKNAFEVLRHSILRYNKVNNFYFYYFD